MCVCACVRACVCIVPQIVEHNWFLDAAEERLLKGKTSTTAAAAPASAPPAPMATKPGKAKKRD